MRTEAEYFQLLLFRKLHLFVLDGEKIISRTKKIFDLDLCKTNLGYFSSQFDVGMPTGFNLMMTLRIKFLHYMLNFAARQPWNIYNYLYILC